MGMKARINEAGKFEPASGESGGSVLGNSYITEFVRCPRSWFNKYYRPTLNDKVEPYRGIARPTTSPHLIIGSMFHEALEQWYLSGVRDGHDTGERDLDHALDHLETYWASRKSEFPAWSTKKQGQMTAEECAQWAHDMVRTMTLGYHDFYGPRANLPEYPDIRVACFDGKPASELTLRFPLKPGYDYTSKVDLLVFEHGNLKVMEHKTTTTYGLYDLISSLPTGSQFTGELWCAQQAFPEEIIAGVMVNAVLKEKPATGKYASTVGKRETTTRTPERVTRWRMGTIAVLDRIEQAIYAYERHCEVGLSPEQAADMAFPTDGERNGHCNSYGGCTFGDLCAMAGEEERQLGLYKPVRPEDLK
jgi:hypothetical protein